METIMNKLKSGGKIIGLGIKMLFILLGKGLKVVFDKLGKVKKETYVILILAACLLYFMNQYYIVDVQKAYLKGCLDTYKHFEKKEEDMKKKVIDIMHTNDCHDYEVFEAITTYSEDPVSYAIMVEIESGYNRLAISCCGALGYGQVLPTHFAPGEDWKDPSTNIRVGASIFNEGYNEFDGNLKKVIVAYNAGIYSARKYGENPPFTETQNYLKTFAQKCQKYGWLT